MPDKPTKAELEWFYTVERLSTHRIGAMYGFPHITICRWMKRFGIARRPTGCGLKNRGLPEPSREQLYALVHLQHKSYDDIAVIFGVHRSAIKFWLDRYDIPRPKIWQTRRKGRDPILPTAEELQRLYVEQGLSTRAIGDMFGVSDGPIASLCRTFGIPVKRDGFNGGSRIECIDGHLVRSTYEQRVCEWLYERGVAHEYEPQLPFDRRYHADFLVSGAFIEIWGVTNSPVYKERVKHKKAMYRANGARLIELPCHAFDTSHKDLWRRRLEALISTAVLYRARPFQNSSPQYPLPL